MNFKIDFLNDKGKFDEGIQSLHSRSFDLSKINYLKTSATNASGKSNVDTKDDDVSLSHVVYDKVERKFHGIPASGFDTNLHWTNVHLAEGWGSQIFENKLWDDEEKYTVKLVSYKDLELTEEEEMGVLTDRIMSTCLFYLDKSPETGEYAFVKCVVINKGIEDISILNQYHYIQYLDLSKNKITNIEALGRLPFLMYLDLSNNSLTETLQFTAPFNLMFVNLSYNEIREISDLSDFWTIIVLDLSHNEIEEIKGLHNLRHLRALNLSYNWIKSVKNLDNLRLTSLDLFNNLISECEERKNMGLKTMLNLKKLSLARNAITSLKVIEGCRFLRWLDISDNKIEDLVELIHLRNLNELRELDMRDNSIRNLTRYFDTCVNCCKHIIMLDGEKITAETKVLSRKKFDNSLFDVNKFNNQHLLLKEINYPNVIHSTIPYTDPPIPMIVLCGPPSSMKGLMVDICCEVFPKYIIRGVNHTTRPRIEGEIDGEQYHFITYEEFKEMVRKGVFYTTSEYFGHFYGFARTEFSKVEKTKKVMLLHSDLNGALLFRARGLRPTLVLTISKTEEMHRKYLRRKYFCHSLSAGILEIGESQKMAYQGLIKVKKWNQRKIVNQAKTMLSTLFHDLQEEIKKDIPEYSNLSVFGMPAFRPSFLTDKKTNEQCLKRLNVSISIEQTSLEELMDATSASTNSTVYSKEIAQENAHLDELFQEILDSRKTYLEMHWANPGLFAQVLFTDVIETGLDVMSEVIKSCVQTYHLRSPICPMKHPPKTHPLVKKRINYMKSLMNLSKQKITKHSENINFQNVEGGSYNK